MGGTRHDDPVLIVGAGPSGLAAALECALAGRPCRILERNVERSPFSKALAINPRTLELLEPSGATDRLLECGRIVPGARMWDDDRLLGGFDFTSVGGRYDHMTALPQSETEDVLEERLAKLGVLVERGVELEALDVGEDGVSARLGTGERVDAPFVIGADGAGSSVRAALGFEMAGDELPGLWGLADVRLHAGPDRECANVISTSFGFVFALRIRDDQWRIASNVVDWDRGSGPISGIREVLWRSEFRVQHRVATSFGTRRVLLVGDAAHLHSPIGGRGMNLGIEDAVLGVRALTSGGWLEAHRRARRRKAARVVAFVRRQTVQAIGTNPIVRRLRRVVAPLFLRLSPIQRFAARFVLGTFP